MKYLVTGGLGVVGSCLARQLLGDGHEVEIIDACEEPRNDWMARAIRAEFPRVEIWRRRLEEANLSELDSYDAIIHAAAHTGIPHSATHPGEDWQANVEATRWLLEALRVAKRKIPTVVMSSVKPYRVHDMLVRQVGNRYFWDPLYGGISESWPLEPDEPYAASKMAQSALAMAYARAYDLPITTLRFSNLYGPAPCHGPRHGWLTWFCISVALGRPLEVQGSGLQVRDMLYSTDINAALLAALEHIDRTAGNVYNVGGGFSNSISVLEAVEALGHVPALSGPGRKNEDPIFITDYDKFHAATGWKPVVDVKVGIGFVLAWAKAHEKQLREVYAWLD